MLSYERLHIDRPLFYGLVILSLLSILTVFSASGSNLDTLLRHLVRLAFGYTLLVMIAQVRPDTLMRLSPIIYVVGLILLLAVAAVGTTSKGATRWLHLGVVTIQPSEMMKLAIPMMLAWYLSRESLPPRPMQLLIAALIVLAPAALIAKQPDLGTAILVFGSGMAVLFLAGLSWRLITGLGVALLLAIPLIWNYALREYQRQRILTLIDPAADPLGAGYHTLQGMIAVGSGGLFGKGWLNSSQAHLDYLPEATTDFIFAVFAEEFGLLGTLILLGVYAFVLSRGLIIAHLSQETYSRLLAGGLSLVVFFYLFVNIGMVTGILPVVGVPLPMMSYGGTAIVTLMLAFGMLMSMHTHRKIVG